MNASMDLIPTPMVRVLALKIAVKFQSIKTATAVDKARKA